MQMHFQRAMRLGAVALGSMTLLGLGASSASATTNIRYGLPLGSNPTSSSNLVPAGDTIGATSIKSSSFTSPQQGSSAPNPTTGSCSGPGSVSGIIGTNPNSPSVSFSSAALTIGAANGTASGCTDNGPQYDLQRITLTSPSTFSVTANASPPPNGTLSIVNPKFDVTVKTTSGIYTTCKVELVSSGSTITGALLNSDSAASNHPTVNFTNVAVKAVPPSGGTLPTACSGAIGDGSTSAKQSVFNVKFGPLVILAPTGQARTGARVGVFYTP